MREKVYRYVNDDTTGELSSVRDGTELQERKATAMF